MAIERLSRALDEFVEWRAKVNHQQAVHLWQFLALRRSGVDQQHWAVHEEADDQRFWDTQMRVRSGDEPYFDPITNSFRIASHWHSNIATARKNTFKNRWQAAEVNPDNENQWRLNPGYLDTLISKAWTRAGETTALPIHALLAWLYRSEQFDDTTSLDAVRERFRSEYNLSGEEVSRLFQNEGLDGESESDEAFFSAQRLDQDSIRDLLEARTGNSTAPADEPQTVAPGVGVSPARIAKLLSDGRGQLVLHGPPGTGKTLLARAAVAHMLKTSARTSAQYQVDPHRPDSWRTAELADGAWSLVQFHPSYVYEDFIRGIHGTVTSQGLPKFEVVDRIIPNLCRLASQIDGPVILIVDEINRGDLAKVIGELVYALEYRGEPITLQHSHPVHGSQLVMPENFKIIATMNSADKSVAHLDYAIRRRFDFVQCRPHRTVVDQFLAGSTVQEKALSLYDAIALAVDSDTDHAVGHAYFLHRSPEALAHAFVFQVLPLLAEYVQDGLIDAQTLTLADAELPEIPIMPDDAFTCADEIREWLTRPL